MRGTPTLEDVARRAEVSTATVSRCLNTPDKVNAATRERVLEAVRDLGYAPNFGARAMAARRTRTIGAVIPTMENAIFAQGLQAFQETLHQRGYTLLVASSSYSPEREDEQIRALVARGADGLLLIGYDRSEATQSFLERRALPALVTWTHAAEAWAPSVGFDNRSAMRALAEEALGLGHSRIAVISAPQAQNDRARARVRGIRDAVTAAGMDASAVPVIETAYDIDEGARAFAALMQRDPRPTLVMCGNDVLAAGAVRQARTMGLDVPGAVSVTGFDDIEIAKVVDPALTTVRVPHRAMGQASASLLIRMVEGEANPASVLLEAHIQRRGSLAPPQA